MAEDVEIRCVSKFNSIRFCSTERGNLALAEGTFQAGDDSGLFGLALLQTRRRMVAQRNSVNCFYTFCQHPRSSASTGESSWKHFELVNIWPSESSNHEGALLSLNLKLAHLK